MADIEYLKYSKIPPSCPRELLMRSEIDGYDGHHIGAEAYACPTQELLEKLKIHESTRGSYTRPGYKRVYVGGDGTHRPYNGYRYQKAHFRFSVYNNGS